MAGPLCESDCPGRPDLVRGPASRVGSAIAMWLIRAALRRPITIVVAMIAVASAAFFAVARMRADIFPDLDLPVIYVAQPYGGMSPAQMEGYITYYYEYHFLYVNGIESVESKSIQNTSLLKLTFHAGTDMAEALAQTIGYVNRARAFMPPGTVNIGDETRISPMNSVVSNINDLLGLPIRTGAGPPVSIRDIGSVSDSTDIPTAYALVNGRRAVYIPVTKRPNASTLDVVSA